jgi:hypothetical protein
VPVAHNRKYRTHSSLGYNPGSWKQGAPRPSSRTTVQRRLNLALLLTAELGDLGPPSADTA